MVFGLKVNMDKSILVIINSNQEKISRMAGILGCKVGEWLLKYVGLPLDGNPLALSFWDPIIEKIG